LPAPEMYYCSTSLYKILSPQHLDKMWRQKGIGAFSVVTDITSTKIHWTDSEGVVRIKTIPHTSKSGIPVCYTAPSYKKYHKYICSNVGIVEDERTLISCLTEIVARPPEGVLQVDTFGNVLPPAQEENIVNVDDDVNNQTKTED
jgi:hypothetical protein